MINFIDSLLNKITMYRLVLYYLIALLAVAAIFGAFGVMPYGPVSLAVTALILIVACWSANNFFAKIFRAQTNAESVYITALILALIISPIKVFPLDQNGFWFLVAASAFAMGSKYILAIGKKHIFNPAAVAVALTAIFFGQYASWWIGGNLPMLAFVVAGGLLVVRKIQRFDLVLAFFAAALASIILTSLSFDPVTTAEKAIFHTTLLFFAFVMLTEPLTTPPTRPLRILYGAFVGFLFAPAVHIGSIYSTPELALVAGNIFSYLISPGQKYFLKLDKKTQVGAGIYDFAFTAGGKKLNFKPGQYMEFTLGHVQADSRGNRRYFTVASSPTENEVHLGVKFYENSSTFKKRMLELGPGDEIVGAQVAGDFTLPRYPDRKLVFIAGGIGITPFRSMVKYLSDRAKDAGYGNGPSDLATGGPFDPTVDNHRDAVLLYSNRFISEIAYREVFEKAAHTIGLKTVYAITGTKESAPGLKIHSGRIDADLIEREVPDYRERMFYISGTRTMVNAFTKTLRDMGVPRAQVKADFFPGF